METETLFSPQLAVQAGPYRFGRGIAITVSSARNTCFDWAKVRFTEQFQPVLDLAPGVPASISLGYDGALSEVFTGYVARPYSGGNTDEIQLQDEMLLLEKTVVHSTFLQTTPQEIIACILAQAGIKKMALSSRIYPERRQLPIRRQNGVQAIRTVHGAWGLDIPFFFSEGVFYWGEKPIQKKMYTFEYGVNILGLTRADGMWELETVSAPFVRHSHRIRVVHPRLSGEFEVAKVLISTNDAGFIRTKFYF